MVILYFVCTLLSHSQTCMDEQMCVFCSGGCSEADFEDFSDGDVALVNVNTTDCSLYQKVMTTHLWQIWN